MYQSVGAAVVAGCVLGIGPVSAQEPATGQPVSVAEPIAVDVAVRDLNQLCVASRRAFLGGGTVRLRNDPNGPVVQVQRYDPVAGRVGDSGWPSVTQRGVGTFDRSGFLIDARLRRSQVEQAARYLGYSKHPWVVSKGQFGVIASRSFRQFLREDLLAPDRFIDLDSTTVPAQPQRCASHLLGRKADASIQRTVDGDASIWTLSYLLDDGAGDVRVDSTLNVKGGLVRSGSTRMRGEEQWSGVDLDNAARWTYRRPKVRLPKPSKVVAQRQWIRATDAAALVTDLRFLAGSFEGRRSLERLRKVAARSVKAANRGHAVTIRLRDVPNGIVFWGRNPYTGQTVAFEVTIQRRPTAVVHRLS